MEILEISKRIGFLTVRRYYLSDLNKAHFTSEVKLLL